MPASTPTSRPRGLSTAAVALVAAAGAVLVLPGLAGAQGGPIDAARKTCDAAVAKRLTSLGTVRQALDGTPAVSAPDRAMLDSQIDAAATGMTALKATIDADATLAKLRADCRMLVSGYYVYALLIPRVELVRAAGRVQAAAGTLKHLAGLLQARVDGAKARNRDIASAQGYVTDLALKAFPPPCSRWMRPASRRAGPRLRPPGPPSTPPVGL
jgi:hypothetical protein